MSMIPRCKLCAQQATKFSRRVTPRRNETYQSAEDLPAFLAETACALLVYSGLAIIEIWHTRCLLKEPMTPGPRLEVELPHVIPVNGAVPSAVRNGTSHRQAAVLRLGDLLIAERLATEAQVQKALRAQGQANTYMPLGHILVAHEVLTRHQLVSVLERYRRRSKLGELLVKTHALTPEQLATALAEQRRWKQTLGEAVIRLKFVTEEQLRRALCLQLHINFFDLATIALDMSLRPLINPRFAMKRLVVPVALVGQTLVVAMDDPTRTAVIDDLKSSTGFEIEVITSTRASIVRALEQMYPGSMAAGPNGHAPHENGHEPQPLLGEPHVLSFEEIESLSEGSALDTGG